MTKASHIVNLAGYLVGIAFFHATQGRFPGVSFHITYWTCITVFNIINHH